MSRWCPSCKMGRLRNMAILYFGGDIHEYECNSCGWRGPKPPGPVRRAMHSLGARLCGAKEEHE